MPGSRSLRLKQSKKQGIQRSGQTQATGTNAGVGAGAGSAKGTDKPGRIHVKADPPVSNSDRDGEPSRPRPQPIEPVTTTVHTSEGIGGALASALRILGLKAVPINDASTPDESKTESVKEQQKPDEGKGKAVAAAPVHPNTKQHATNARPGAQARNNTRPDDKARAPIRSGAPLPPVLQKLTTYGMSTAEPSQAVPAEDDSNVATDQDHAGAELDIDADQRASSPSHADKVQDSMKQLSEVHELVKQAVQAFASVMKKVEHNDAGPSTDVFVTPPETPVVHDAVEVESQSAAIEDTGDSPESLAASDSLSLPPDTHRLQEAVTADPEKGAVDNESDQDTGFMPPDTSPLVYRKPYNGLPEHSFSLIATYLAEQGLQETLASLSQTCKSVYQAVLPKLYERRSLCPRTLAPLVLRRGTEKAREWYCDERWPERAALLPGPDVRIVRQIELLGYARRLYIDVRLPAALEQLLHMRANRERTFAQVRHIDLGADLFGDIAYNLIEDIDIRSNHMFYKMLRDSFAPKIHVCASPRVSQSIARYREHESEFDGSELSDDGPENSSPELSLGEDRHKWGFWLRGASEHVLNRLSKMDCIDSLTVHDLRPGEPIAIHRYGETVLDFRLFLRNTYVNVPTDVMTAMFSHTRCEFLREIATLIRDLPDDWAGRIVFRNITWLIHPTSEIDAAVREYWLQYPSDRGCYAGQIVQSALGHEAINEPIFQQRCSNGQFVVLDDHNQGYYCETCQSFPKDPDENKYPKWF